MSTTQIVTRQIADGAVTDVKVAAGAAIASAKLADGANFVKKDGTVAFTGNADLGNNKGVNVGTPTAGTDAANKSYVDTQISNLNSLFDSKGSTRSATTANVTISNPGTAVFDGVTLSTLDRLLVKAQTAPAENGIYVFNGSGVALTRVLDMDVWAEVPGALVIVEEGTANADTIWLCTSNQGGTIGTTAVTWVQVASTGLSAANFVTEEVPSGSINGSNVTFTLANTPTTGTVRLFLNGLRQRAGGNDYAISGTTITMTTAPLTGEYLTGDYQK